MRTFILALATLAALTVVSGAQADGTDARFRDYLASKYGAGHPGWAECPKVERFGGMALCEAQFRQGRKWRFVSAVVRRQGKISYPYTRSWVRKWRTCPKRYVPGKLVSNGGNCGGYELMAGDIQYSVKHRRRFPRRVYVHGTNTAGFGERVDYKCSHRGRAAHCTNSLGDSFKYTVPR